MCKFKYGTLRQLHLGPNGSSGGYSYQLVQLGCGNIKFEKLNCQAKVQMKSRLTPNVKLQTPNS